MADKYRQAATYTALRRTPELAVAPGLVIANGEVEVAGAGQAATASRLEALRRATTTWTGQLVDLTGRNSVLYYRDLKVGTLPFDSSPRRS